MILPAKLAKIGIYKTLGPGVGQGPFPTVTEGRMLPLDVLLEATPVLATRFSAFNPVSRSVDVPPSESVVGALTKADGGRPPSVSASWGLPAYGRANTRPQAGCAR